MEFRLRRANRTPDPDAVGRLARLLALAWAQPDLRLATGLIDGGWVDEIRAALAGLGGQSEGLTDRVEAALAVLGRAVNEQTPEQLSLRLGAEYAALFQGPGRSLVCPYECQWVDAEDASLFMAPSTVAVEAAYRSAGLAISTREPPDSMAVELEFVGRLATRQAGAAKAEAVGLHGQRVQFVAAHPARWIEPFCDAVEHATEEGFYAALARITREVNASGVLGR